MGHYDECYASDDFSKMSSREKSSYISRFENELKEKGYTGAYFADVGGYILLEYAEGRKDLIVAGGHGDILVKTKEYAEKEKEERKAAALKRKLEEEARVQSLREQRKLLKENFKKELDLLYTPDQYNVVEVKQYKIDRLLDEYVKAVGDIPKE